MTYILSQVGNISPIELPLRVVEVSWLDALGGLHVSIVAMVLVWCLVALHLAHIVCHVHSSC